MATDQEIRDAGILYMPKQKYLQNPYNLPIAPVPPTEPVPGGITNTNAFTGGGNDNFNPEGNAFGYGEVVQRPGNTYADIVQRTGPDSQQAKQALVKAGGTYPAGLQSNEGGFEYTSDFGNELDYSKGAFDSLESEEEKKGFLSKMMNSFKQKTADLPSWAKAGITAAGMLNPITAIPSLIGKFGGGGEGGGPSYGIAGLSNEQKAMYDSLSGAGFLYNGPNGMKTYDGKNFSKVDQSTVDKYFASKKNITRGDTKIKTLKDYEAYIADKPNLLRTYKQYQLLDGTLDTFSKNETIREEQKQKIRNAEISRRMRSGDSKNNPFADNYTNKTTLDNGAPNPDYTPRGPNQPDPTPTPTTNNDNDNDNDNDGQNNAGDSSQRGDGSWDSSPFAKGGRAGYFFGGRVNYKQGGRTGYFLGGNIEGGYSESRNDSGGKQTTTSYSDNDDGGGASDNPPVTVVNNNPVDVSTVTKSVGDYEIPYGVEALMANKGRLQAVLNADNVLDKNLGAEFTYDNGPFSIGAYADMDGDKSLNANYTRNNSNYSFDLNDDGGQLKYSKTFANGGLASIL